MVLEEITDENWRDVADVAPADDRRRFVAALGARYPLLSQRGGLWNSLGVRAGDEVVGHVMWAYDDEDGTHWIGGMIVNAEEQGRGVGRAASRPCGTAGRSASRTTRTTRPLPSTSRWASSPPATSRTRRSSSP